MHNLSAPLTKGPLMTHLALFEVPKLHCRREHTASAESAEERQIYCHVRARRVADALKPVLGR